jgi:hypothetical protein
MTLSDLAAIGSLVGSGAVVVSLVYLALQVRHADLNQQAAIRHSRITRVVELNQRIADPALAEVWRKGLAGLDLTQPEISQFYSLCRAMFYHLEDSFYQREEGLLNDEAFRTVAGGSRQYAHNPGVRIAWKAMRGSFFSGNFQKFMDGFVAEPIEQANFPPTPEVWKAMAAAERATASRN